MKQPLQAMAADQADALATIFLKRRADFQIYRPGLDAIGIDLIVHVQTAQHLSGRIFGVIVKYTAISRDIKKNGFDISTRYLNISTNIPILVLVFTMQSNEGYFTWLYEPHVVDGQAKLHHVETKNTESLRLRGFQDLDVQGLDRIADAVNAWYDARLIPIS